MPEFALDLLGPATAGVWEKREVRGWLQRLEFLRLRSTLGRDVAGCAQHWAGFDGLRLPINDNGCDWLRRVSTPDFATTTPVVVIDDTAVILVSRVRC